MGMDINNFRTDKGGDPEKVKEATHSLEDAMLARSDRECSKSGEYIDCLSNEEWGGDVEWDLFYFEDEGRLVRNRPDKH